MTHDGIIIKILTSQLKKSKDNLREEEEIRKELSHRLENCRLSITFYQSEISAVQNALRDLGVITKE